MVLWLRFRLTVTVVDRKSLGEEKNKKISKSITLPLPILGTSPVGVRPGSAEACGLWSLLFRWFWAAKADSMGGGGGRAGRALVKTELLVMV